MSDYIPDPIELMESRIERNIEEYVEGHCMNCGDEVDYELIPVSASPDAPVVCLNCLSPEDRESIYFL